MEDTGIILSPDMTEEEMDKARSNAGGTNVLLENEEDVPVEVLSVRQNVLRDTAQTSKWKFPERNVIIFNVKFRVASTHEGINRPGRQSDFTGGFGLTKDGTMIDWELDKNQDNRANFLRDLIPLFGGWNAKKPGAYPKQENGTLICPTYLVGNKTEFETRLLGASCLVNITTNQNETRNYFSSKPLEAVA